MLMESRDILPKITASATRISPKQPAHHEEDESLFSVKSCAAQQLWEVSNMVSHCHIKLAVQSFKRSGRFHFFFCQIKNTKHHASFGTTQLNYIDKDNNKIQLTNTSRNIILKRPSVSLQSNTMSEKNAPRRVPRWFFGTNSQPD